MKFFVGLHHPNHASHFERACVSIKRLRGRRKPIENAEIIIDSGAFTELAQHGRYRDSVEVYVRELARLYVLGVVRIAAAVAQDYMCEPFMLAKTGLTVAEHQYRTIKRYDQMMEFHLPFTVMPVLQGYAPEDYVAHLDAYDDRLTPSAWVGVGSVCKRNSNPAKIIAVLSAIHARRPDLRLHGFGIKTTALADHRIRGLLHSADSMAWSFHARRNGRGYDANRWEEAMTFVNKIERLLE